MRLSGMTPRWCSCFPEGVRNTRVWRAISMRRNRFLPNGWTGGLAVLQPLIEYDLKAIWLPEPGAGGDGG